MKFSEKQMRKQPKRHIPDLWNSNIFYQIIFLRKAVNKVTFYQYFSRSPFKAFWWTLFLLISKHHIRTSVSSIIWRTYWTLTSTTIHHPLNLHDVELLWTIRSAFPVSREDHWRFQNVTVPIIDIHPLDSNLHLRFFLFNWTWTILFSIFLFVNFSFTNSSRDHVPMLKLSVYDTAATWHNS